MFILEESGFANTIVVHIHRNPSKSLPDIHSNTSIPIRLSPKPLGLKEKISQASHFIAVVSHYMRHK
jgi:hypothetical protein